MCVPSIAPITLGKPLICTNPLDISIAFSSLGHLIKTGAKSIKAFTTLLTDLKAVARPILNFSQIDLQYIIYYVINYNNVILQLSY